MMDSQWPRYEVFLQDREGRPHRNVGSVHAPDAEMAMQNARDVFVRRPTCLSLWVVLSEDILSKTVQELREESLQDVLFADEPAELQKYAIFQKTRQRRSMTYVEFAGEVVGKGKSVKKFEVGDKVFGIDGEVLGSYAKFKCITENGTLFTIPNEMTFEEAAAFPNGFLTAYYFLEVLGKIQATSSLRAEKLKVLINGASGSVGLGANVLTIFLCHADFDSISRGYLSRISFICLTLSSLSGIITSLTFSPYQASGTNLEIIPTARSPVIFQLQILEYLSSTYSNVPIFSMDVSIICG